MVLVQNLIALFSFVLGKSFTALSPAWWPWQAILNFSHSSVKLRNQNRNFQPDSNIISWHLRKQVQVMLTLCISNSVALLRVRKINIETKWKKKVHVALISYLSNRNFLHAYARKSRRIMVFTLIKHF